MALQQLASVGQSSWAAAEALNSAFASRISVPDGVKSPLCAMAGPAWIARTSMQTISAAKYLSIPRFRNRTARPFNIERIPRSGTHTICTATSN